MLKTHIFSLFFSSSSGILTQHDTEYILLITKRSGSHVSITVQTLSHQSSVFFRSACVSLSTVLFYPIIQPSHCPSSKNSRTWTIAKPALKPSAIKGQTVSWHSLLNFQPHSAHTSSSGNRHSVPLLEVHSHKRVDQCTSKKEKKSAHDSVDLTHGIYLEDKPLKFHLCVHSPVQQPIFRADNNKRKCYFWSKSSDCKVL